MLNNAFFNKDGILFGMRRAVSNVKQKNKMFTELK